METAIQDCMGGMLLFAAQVRSSGNMPGGRSPGGRSHRDKWWTFAIVSESWSLVSECLQEVGSVS